MFKRMSLLVVVDSLIVLTSIYICYFILHPDINIFANKMLLISVVSIFIAHHAFAAHYGLYRKAWSYASIGELTSIFKAVTLTIVVVAFVQIAVMQDVYMRALFLTWMLHILLIGASRLSWRVFRDSFMRQGDIDAKRTMIIGAGQAGSMVVRQLSQNPDSGMNPILFVDDDQAKRGLYGWSV